MRFFSRVAVLVTRPWWRNPQNLLRLGALVAVLLIFGIAFLVQDRIDFEQVGYAGLGLTVLVASGGLVLPVPSLATTCAAGALLNPWIVALIAGSAGALGELTGYFLGFSGRGILSQNRLYVRMEGWMRRGGWIVLFLVALVPNPIFDVAGIAAGALRYPVWRFLLIVWLGKLGKFLIFAHACRAGLGWVTGLFGVELPEV